jgi:hypothetical protein
VLSGTLQVRLQVVAYSFLLANRQPAAISQLRGSGLTSPSFLMADQRGVGDVAETSTAEVISVNSCAASDGEGEGVLEPACPLVLR